MKMNPVCNNFTPDLLPLKPPFLNPNPKFINPRFPNSITLTKPSNPRRRITYCSRPDTNSSPLTASITEVDMVKNSRGVWLANKKRVVVLWDLDNKPPHGPPYQAAMALKKVALKFGDIVEISTYANRHAFVHLPHWVRQERSECKGITIPSDPYICGVCGRKCRTNSDDDYDDVGEKRNLDQLVDEHVITNTSFRGCRISAFSEGGDEEY